MREREKGGTYKNHSKDLTNQPKHVDLNMDPSSNKLSINKIMIFIRKLTILILNGNLMILRNYC